MNDDIKKAYETLVPSDQLLIDAIIVTLYKKDKQIRDVVEEVTKMLDAEQQAKSTGREYFK